MIELLILFLVILIFASMISISMVAFTIAFKSLIKLKVLEDELTELKQKLKKVK
jgi:hypothetical protein